MVLSSPCVIKVETKGQNWNISNILECCDKAADMLQTHHALLMAFKTLPLQEAIQEDSSHLGSSEITEVTVIPFITDGR